MAASRENEDRRSRWAVDSRRYAERPDASVSGPRGPEPAPLVAPDLAAAQRELTGVFWRTEGVDLDLIRPRETGQALARFRAALPDIVWNAAALEGNTITLPEVRTLLDGTTIAGRRIEDQDQVRALGDAYTLLDRLVGSGEFRLDKATSDRLHGIVARHEAIESGAFRGEGTVRGGGSVQLSTGGVVEGVLQSELPERWDRLMDYLGDPGMRDPRLRALVYNAAATRSQFYFDGNKRTARLMMAGELMSHGFDSIHVPYARLLEYNLALDALFRTDDATELMAFTASCAPRDRVSEG